MERPNGVTHKGGQGLEDSPVCEGHNYVVPVVSTLHMLRYIIFTTILFLFAFHRWRNRHGEIKYCAQSQNEALSGSTGLKTTQYKITLMTLWRKD